MPPPETPERPLCRYDRLLTIIICFVTWWLESRGRGASGKTRRKIVRAGTKGKRFALCYWNRRERRIRFLPGRVNASCIGKVGKSCRKMRNVEISKELRADIDANQNMLKAAIRNHQVSFCTVLVVFFPARQTCNLGFARGAERDGDSVTWCAHTRRNFSYNSNRCTWKVVSNSNFEKFQITLFYFADARGEI